MREKTEFIAETIGACQNKKRLHNKKIMDKVQHFEIPADDLNRAKKFYGEAFGWKLVDFPMPDMEYTGVYTTDVDEKHMPKEAGAINGGMFKRNAGLAAKNPTIAVTVDDIDATIKKIKALGGTVIMEKKQIGTMGFYSYIKDTEGNVIGVWQNLKDK